MDDFDAADVARGIHELYEPLAEDDGMTLRVDAAPATLHGNRELIGQALANLVENAIKYGKPSPVVQPLDPTAAVRTREILIEARHEGDTVLLSVTDHGPAFPDRPQARAVERFVRSSEPDAAGFRPASAWRRRLRHCMAVGSRSPIASRPDRDAGDPGHRSQR
jgi:signal transduction histidine kinase